MARHEPGRPHRSWTRALEVSAPGEGAVRVFSLSLDPEGERLLELASLLSADETARAQRFHFPRDRRRFITGRASLRVILAACLGESPERIAFAYGPQGKPALAPRLAGSGLRFNVSHSEDLGLLAVAWGRDLGVDVERKRPLRDLVAIALRFFSPREREELLSLGEHEREEAFFAIWTRKEAFIKATGEGLSRPLDGFSVSLRREEPARLTHVADDPEEVSRWSLVPLEPAPGFAAALVTRGATPELLCNDWPVAGVPPSGAAPPSGIEPFLEAR